MQLKLLNFHKVLAQFAANLVGAFIALIIYQSTGSFTWAFLYMAIAMVIRIVITKIFYKQFISKPQIFLVLRLIPFLLYSLSVLLLDTDYMVLGIVLSSVFYGFNVAFKDVPTETVFSYSALNKGSSSNGLSRLFEYAGVILALILGGLLLDDLPKIYVVLISCGSYLISVIPLLIYYILQRKNKGFNKEAVSNAVESFKNIRIKKHQQAVISKILLHRYFIVYFLFCFYDALMPVLSLYMFKVNAESYQFVSYIQAAFYSMFGLGCYVAGKLDDKIDLTASVMLCCVISGVVVCLVPFLANYVIVEVVFFAIIGFLYSFISIFCYSRMMTRCKIMGISNLALGCRAQASRVAQLVVYLFAAISPVMILPSFFLMGGAFASCSVVIPINEEKTRTMLVDYLQNNKLY